MGLGTKVLIVGGIVCAAWMASGIGVNVGKSALHPGGEVGWYFSCVYFAPQRSFEVNFSDAVRAPAGAGSFFEKRTDCPAFAHESREIVGWRH